MPLPVRSPGDRLRRVLPGTLLFLIVAGVFLPAVTHTFIPYDDPTYVTQNPHVTGGLSWENIRWAFTSTEASNWHPLTWLSHMVDCQLFGQWAGGHHLTNVLLHALACVLLFVALRKMTDAFWPSLAVAALFGLHPLHVESVAWIAERKDVLSTTFWMLVLWTYAVRAERIRTGRPGAGPAYGGALALFALGLMAKPMLVTLPCVLLLLDVWPLQRWHAVPAKARVRLLVEKLPFFALSVASSAITLYAQRRGGAVASVEDFSPGVRIANAVAAYGHYLANTLVPSKLCIFYPNFARQPPALDVGLSAAALAVITIAALALARRRPYLLVGWLWFLGTLVPVIGFVQVGGQTMADRYTYVPLIGIFLMTVWLVADLYPARPHRSAALGSLAGALFLGLVVLTSRQLAYWKTPVSLFRHAAAVTENNWVAHSNLFIALAPTSPAESQAELRETLRILAEFAGTYEQRGIELARQPARQEDAIKQFQTAIRIMRTLPGPHYQLGLVLARTPGREPEAIAALQTAVGLKPDFAEAHFALADLLAAIPERTDECIAEYQAAIALAPDSYEAHFNLGMVLTRIPWRSGEALMHFDQALRLKPDLKPAQEMLARLRAAP